MNECGSCQECCKGTLTGMTQVNNSKCQHLCNGCSIYNDRPKECVQYNCGWKRDPSMPLWMRPDKSRTIINSHTSDTLFWKGMPIDYVIPIDNAIPVNVINYLVDRQIPFRFLTPKEDGYTMGAFGTAEFKQFVETQGMPN